MKTIVTKKIETNIEGLGFGYWDDESEEFIPVGAPNAADAAEILNCNLVMIDAMISLVDTIKVYLHNDLVDVWKRLDQIEQGLAELSKR